MSGLEVLAVVGCVAAVVSAYHDGSGLVKRIKDKRRERRERTASQENLANETKDLEDSLALGPPIVQGQYDHDFRRFGDRYAYGDQIARESMKDIIISLQMTLLTNLRVAWQDDEGVLDVRTLQIASDDSRVNAVVTLGQLYQRMSAAAPISNTINISTTPPRATTTPRLSYASHSSAGSYNQPTTPISTMEDSSSQLNLTQSSSRPGPTERKSSASSGTSLKRRLFSPKPKPEVEIPKPLFHGSMTASPQPQGFLTPDEADSESLHHLTENAAPPGGSWYRRSINSDRRSINSDLKSINSENIPYPDQSHPDRASYASSGGASRASSGRISNASREYYGPDEITQNPWEEPNSTELLPQSSDHPPSGPKYAPAGVNRSASTPSTTPSTHSWHSTLEVVSRHPPPAQTQLSPQMSRSLTLYLPSEENKFAGFCKGAWKLQIGMKKAMSAEYRPSGMYGQIPFWRCQKCYFEGPMAGTSKATRSFDNRIRENNGIRYRWAFLAKSHVFTKSIGTSPDGSHGTFGCIFCCAELRSVPPMFGNVQSLMDHLQRHRDRPPGRELQDRTRCIVDRIAQPGEDFDINLPSRVQEVQEIDGQDVNF